MPQPHPEPRSRSPFGGPTARRHSRSLPSDPFPYGYRWVAGEMVALTYADLLDPQEGDKVTEDSIHRKLAGHFLYFLEQRFAGEDDVAVWGDFKLRFGEAGKGPGPDVCVLKGVRDPKRRRGSFWVGREPGKPLLVIEIVSREYKKKDYQDTKRIYEREGVPELILVEPQGEYLDGPYRLSCFRLGDSGGYRQHEPGADSGVVSEQADLRIVLDPQGWGLAVFDLRTGERLRTPEEEAGRAEEEARRAAEETRRAAAATHRAEEEAEARKAAEKRAREEASRRRVLEEKLAELEKELQARDRIP